MMDKKDHVWFLNSFLDRARFGVGIQVQKERSSIPLPTKFLWMICKHMEKMNPGAFVYVTLSSSAVESRSDEPLCVNVKPSIQ